MPDRLRRLDALFAERVLGCKVRRDGWTTANMDWTSPEARKIGGNVPLKPAEECEVACGCDGNPHSNHDVTKPDCAESIDLAYYTRSLDAAWSGLAKFGYEVNFSRLNGADTWKCYLLFDDEKLSDQQSRCFAHPAEALVLACLRACGVSEEEMK